ncbi:MAG: NAD(+)--dinitrogen-reductase ADP-D-ribosyltransferase [Zoogloeaceae bacterium]|nr:NAD(+)--dinitrogen-reductase ADP-D-ribosyltransferase [Zoogloeaceae bacterium]
MRRDNRPDFCKTSDKIPGGNPASLPRTAYLPINRCNLPAVILGSLTYQTHPVPLELDGVRALHRDLFARLDAISETECRAEVFRDYMTVHFRLEHLEEAGLTRTNTERANANYMTMICGWHFDSNEREGAAMKGWVESRFGLLPRYHGKTLREAGSEAHRRYLEMRAQGLYGTNALEAQLDIVYTYCQYEFARQMPNTRHLTLYRGVNRLTEFEHLPECANPDPHRAGARVLLFNNLNSLTSNRDRADEFGDIILTVEVPVAKILFHCHLLPGILRSEDEYLAIGGVYRVQCATF